MTFTYAPFYDVEASVGTGAPNRDTDVMLVQYFLWAFVIAPEWPTALDPFAPGDGSPPDAIYPMDGIARPYLGSWIAAFQYSANEAGLGTLGVDGIVSHGGAAWGRVKPRAKNWWTIHAMNHLLFQADHARFSNLAYDETVPEPLRNALNFMVNIDPVPE